MGDTDTWATRQHLIKALGRLQQACLREMDRAQVGDPINGAVVDAFVLYREARLAYHLAHDTPGPRPDPA